MKSVPCPACGRPAPFSAANKWRPFCGERCKTIDLGDWAAERYRVPTQEGPAEEGKDPGGKDPDGKDSRPEE